MGFLNRLFGVAVVVASGASLGEPTFAARLHEQLATRHGNLFYSPASIRLALAMAHAGARGDTALQMERVLTLPADPESAFQALLAKWKALPPSLQLEVSNRLWGARGSAFQEPFLTVLRDRYGAPLEALDFKGNAEASRVTINDAVAHATHDRIRDLIPPHTLDAATRLVLTNAVYFKACWELPFSGMWTKPAPFLLSTGPVDVPLMHQVERFSLAEFPEGQLLELPYEGGAMAMDILLPHTAAGLPALEKAYARGALPAWLKPLTSKRVDVSLPRFRARATFQLGATLQAMGMKRAFVHGQADFSGMDGTHELYLSAVVHQAYVDVKEKGTEAAAATAAVMRAGSAPPRDPPAVFRADHPFLFVIRDTRSGELLFAGRIVDPR